MEMVESFKKLFCRHKDRRYDGIFSRCVNCEQIFMGEESGESKMSREEFLDFQEKIRKIEELCDKLDAITLEDE